MYSQAQQSTAAGVEIVRGEFVEIYGRGHAVSLKEKKKGAGDEKNVEKLNKTQNRTVRGPGLEEKGNHRRVNFY